MTFWQRNSLRIDRRKGSDLINFVTLLLLRPDSVLGKKNIKQRKEKDYLKTYQETHQTGRLSIENMDIVLGMLKQGDVDTGVQIAADGRIWLCVNGVAFIRFHPTLTRYKV